MSRSHWIAVLTLALAACGTDPANAPAGPNLARVTAAGIPGTPLGTLGGPSSYATDINDAGTVVGWSTNAAGLVRPFRWTRSGGMTDLGTLPADTRGAAVRILNSGLILGTSTSTAGRSRPVQWSATGTISLLRIPPPNGTRAVYPSDFNQRGEVVGYSFGGLEHGWYWSRTTGTIDLRDKVPSCLENSATAISASGTVAGVYCAPAIGWLHAFAWRLHQPYVDLGIVGEDIHRANAAALSINRGGTIAGWIDPHGNSNTLPFLWTAARGYTLLPVFPGPFPSGAVFSVNDSGAAVGDGWVEELGGYSAMAWPDTTTLVLLDGPAGFSSVATAVNNGGFAVGWASDGRGTLTALLWRISQGTAVAGVVPSAASVKGAIGARRGAESCLDRPRTKVGMMACAMGKVTVSGAR